MTIVHAYIQKFNHNQIATIHFIGLEDEEQKQNNEKLKELVNNMTNLQEIKLPQNNDNVETLNVN